MYDYFNIDVLEAPHGKVSAVASGVKRARKDRIVFTYQGDGDLAAIGIAEGIHTANRGENITLIFANNGIYGMTGGQMAPTTLLGQKTSTSPYGRDFTYDGYPIRMAEMLATLEGSAFVARVAVNSPANLMKAKRAIRKAFQMQIEEMGFSFVEVLLACPTNWGMTALEANRRVEEEIYLLPVGHPERTENGRLSMMSNEPPHPSPLATRLCHKGENGKNVMLNLFQHLIKSNGYETLKRVQGDKITITTQSRRGEGRVKGY